MPEAADGPPPLRILEVETFGRGGLLHYAYNLSCALADAGHQVTLLTTVGFELHDLTADAAPNPGFSVERRIARWTQGQPHRRSFRWWRSLEAVFDAWTTARYARRVAPDVVHLHSTNTSALLYLWLLRLLGLRVVSTAHVVTPHEPLRFARWIYGAIHRLPHIVVAHSEVDRRRLERELGVDSRRIEVIPHGEYGFFEETAQPPPSPPQARQALGLGESDEVALFFGYIRHYKGLDLLLESWPAVQARRPSARLLIAGNPDRLSPSDRRDLEDEASALGAVCRFEYLPFSEVAALFAAADVLVMPYRSISQSGVLFLALALGVPVVATRVGALPEMLSDGADALLVPPEDPEALAEAVARVLSDPILRTQLAAGGRQVSAAHSWTTIATRTAQSFHDLSRQGGGGTEGKSS